MRNARVLAGVLLIAFFVSCGGDNETDGDDAALVGEAADSLDTVQSEGALLSLATEGAATQVSAVVLPLPATAEDAAAKAAERMEARLSPEGCADITVGGATLTAVLNGCTGRLGLRRLTGTLSVTFSIEEGAVHAEASATGMQVNRATMDINSSLVRMREGDLLVTSVSTRGTGTGPRGKAITREGDYSVTYDPDTECRTLVGEWKTTVGENEWMTQVTGLKRCMYECPADGGKIVHSNSAKDRTITITFDGSAEAKWSSSTGKTGAETLYCGSAEE